jgi:hypothetical protein
MMTGAEPTPDANAAATRSAVTAVVDFRGLSRLLLRIAGAVVVVWAIAQLPTKVMYVIHLREIGLPLWVQIAMVASASALPILLGAALLTFPGVIVNRAISGEPTGATLPEALAKIEGVALAVLGMYMAVQALIDAAYLWGKLEGYWIYVQERPAAIPTMPKMLPDDAATIVATALEFVLGVALILGAARFAQFRRYLAGTRGSL